MNFLGLNDDFLIWIFMWCDFMCGRGDGGLSFFLWLLFGKGIGGGWGGGEWLSFFFL